MIEVNEYVRTKDGIIDKAIIEYNGKCNNSNCSEKHISCKYNYYNEKDIVKHSKQLIDLIKSGDIVNRHLVIDKYEDVDEYGNDFWCLIIEDDSLLNRSIREENIQTIETKESYMANCYKVGGEDEN